MHSIKTKQSFVALRAQGRTYSEIATELNVCRQTLINWSREFEMDISNFRAIEREMLYESLHLSVEHRLRTLGDTLSKISLELMRRDFSDTTTDKLVDLLLKINAVSSNLNNELNFKKIEDKSFVEETVLSLFPSETIEWTG